VRWGNGAGAIEQQRRSERRGQERSRRSTTAGTARSERPRRCYYRCPRAQSMPPGWKPDAAAPASICRGEYTDVSSVEAPRARISPRPSMHGRSSRWEFERPRAPLPLPAGIRAVDMALLALRHRSRRRCQRGQRASVQHLLPAGLCSSNHTSAPLPATPPPPPPPTARRRPSSPLFFFPKNALPASRAQTSLARALPGQPPLSRRRRSVGAAPLPHNGTMADRGLADHSRRRTPDCLPRLSSSLWTPQGNPPPYMPARCGLTGPSASNTKALDPFPLLQVQLRESGNSELASGPMRDTNCSSPRAGERYRFSTMSSGPPAAGI
jgi:hypothetical protein